MTATNAKKIEVVSQGDAGESLSKTAGARKPRSLVSADGDAQALSATLDVNVADRLKPGTYYFSDISDLSGLEEHNHREIDEDDEDFVRLRNSITLGGVKEAIHLFAETDGDRVRIKIVAGHRRTRAVRALREIGNMVKLPAKLEVPTPGQDKAAKVDRYMTAAVTNLVRKDLRGLERAKAVSELLDAGMKISEVSMALGLDRKIVERSQNLLLLPENAQDFITKHISTLRESNLFAIAQKYKSSRKDVESGDSTPDEKVSTISALETELMAALEEERAFVAAGGRGSATSTTPRNKPIRLKEGQRVVDEKAFEARLTLSKVPAATIKTIMEALNAAIIN